MLNLANLAEEVQIAYRRRQKLKKKGDFVDENNATTESDIEETLKKLVGDLKKSPQEVFDALKNQTVDLVLTAHPTHLSEDHCFKSMEGSVTAWLSCMLKTLHLDDKQSLMRLYRGRFKLLSN
ncbi:Phosphoenolpyruvate carboxylase 1 [Datura stramonium]|uniref:Phosphoenolpyruvate carboxylase 1 n=1 Tax=Datura stramonium TaxID=4076 RepID=A0ABS8WEJ4_DATST|nr:Phosphoenolpyruvate carboxylase 1 [Datura stramonium]